MHRASSLRTGIRQRTGFVAAQPAFFMTVAISSGDSLSKNGLLRRRTTALLEEMRACALRCKCAQACHDRNTPRADVLVAYQVGLRGRHSRSCRRKPPGGEG